MTVKNWQTSYVNIQREETWFWKILQYCPFYFFTNLLSPLFHGSFMLLLCNCFQLLVFLFVFVGHGSPFFSCKGWDFLITICFFTLHFLTEFSKKYEISCRSPLWLIRFNFSQFSTLWREVNQLVFKSLGKAQGFVHNVYHSFEKVKNYCC